MAAAYASGAQRGLGMSFFSAGGNLGFAIGPILMTWLLGWFDLRGTLFLGVMALAAAALIHVYRGEIEVPAGLGTRRQSADGGQVPRGRLLALCGLIALRSWGSSGLVIFIPLYLVQQGMALPLTGRALFVFLFFGAFGGMLGGHLSDRVGRQQVIAGSLLCFPGLMAAALLVPGAARWFLLALAGMALLASFSVTVVFAQELLPRHVGLASGLTFGLSFGMGGLGVWVSGVVADLLGLAASIWILVLLPGIGGMVALGLRSGRGMPASRPTVRAPRPRG
jgi:FSR family fosmidomycin resistance protein-like MFS transporter